MIKISDLSLGIGPEVILLVKDDEKYKIWGHSDSVIELTKKLIKQYTEIASSKGISVEELLEIKK